MHCRAHQTRVLDDALLLVSELVTNAVRHGAPPITMHVTCDHNTGMTVRVSDTNPTLPTAGPADHGQESGRGVGLVDVLSDEWGVEAAEAGKAVCDRLAPLEAAPTPPQARSSNLLWVQPRHARRGSRQWGRCQPVAGAGAGSSA